ncbi:nucleotide exchange factor GrpE [Streptomyces sp. CB01635]|uniref:nucleotide exchange factor GrpE n=1 Tax=unclassified Streptomyces TaxID=2593676 RepID=UPI000C271800|nr:nucleotide exchange factor GrpE [Streptomyces sp. CB01635]PJN05596.1 nucleotide exchange factor GrpE [Streptomyces sp. CB01635]
MEKEQLQLTDPELRRLVEERTADLQRVKAEYDNYRKQVRRDRMAVREIAVANVLRALLPVLDTVDGACAHEPTTPGLKEVTETLRAHLGSLGLQSFGEAGDEFDPVCHEAVTHHVSPEAHRLFCSQILSPGYRLGDRLLRAAYVEVTGPRPERNHEGAEGRAIGERDSELPSRPRAGPGDHSRPLALG